MQAVGVFFSALVLAFFVEAILEYILGIWWKPLSDTARPKVIMAAGLILGIGLCIGFKVDLLTELGFNAGILGQILTGAIVGRGADYLHKFWKKITGGSA